MKSVVTAILGGGQGTRLWPLTHARAKPAVPLGGKFRLIDIPISNSLHADITRIYVLTQYASATLHRHIAQTYRFDHFGQGFVDILAAEQSPGNHEWFQGTADAVRQTLPYLLYGGSRDVLILSGDQLYLMDLPGFIRRHREVEADITIAVKPVSRAEAPAFGIMRVDDDGRIVEFVEKPQEAETLDDLALTSRQIEQLGFDAEPGTLLASMGIYVFRSAVLPEALESDADDFGKEVIPQSLERYRVHAFPHYDYWEDVGTIDAYHRANLALTDPLPPLNLYDPERPIYTRPRFLPGTKMQRCEIERAVLCEGSLVSDSRIHRSIVGIRAVVRERSTLENSIVMGAQRYESDEENSGTGVRLGIGRNCVIRNAIVDLDARVGDGVKLVNTTGVQEADGPNWHIRGGVIVVPRGTTIEPGTVI